MAGEYNFTIDQGTDFSVSMKVKDSAGNMRDLSTYTARMQARVKIRSSATVLDIDSTTEITLDDNLATYNLIIALTDTVTAALDFSTAFYDLELIDGSGNVERLLQGVIRLSREVTR